jgi:hypothetical protein
MVATDLISRRKGFTVDGLGVEVLGGSHDGGTQLRVLQVQNRPPVSSARPGANVINLFTGVIYATSSVFPYDLG